VILLDSHIWIWWVDGSSQLTSVQRQHIEAHEGSGLGVSVVSCWEVCKLVELNRLVLRQPVADWINQALAYPGIRLLYLTPRIAIESTQLPGTFHRDPADQIIVATARIRRCPLLTADGRILGYPHVKTLT
jgi:PIN domain nuclease of toxin-antitoxin system